MTDKNKDLPKILAQLRKKFGDEAPAKPVYDWLCEKEIPAGWILTPARRIARGVYTLADDVSTVSSVAPARRSASKREPAAVGLESMVPSTPVVEEPVAVAANVSAVVVPINVRQAARMVSDNLVPEVDPTYVPFGHFRDVLMIIDTKIFYPGFITGLSGNGKTVMVEQACARLKRNCIRVNVTEETDEDDLIGGNTLVDGNVVYREGPVLTAMRTGSVLILDEVDLNATKILCLQSIMEGKPYFNKKTGETVHPLPGFNVFATANTKGRGSDTGRFIGTKMMNEAFLERFPITFEQEYPSASVEKKILSKNFTRLGLAGKDVDTFVDNLAKWSEVIRKSYDEQAVEDVISTRRLVAIAKAFAIFKDRMKAITLCLARFDEQTKEIFADLYTKIDAEVERAPKVSNIAEPDDDDDVTSASAYVPSSAVSMP